MSAQPNVREKWMGRALLAFPPRWRDERGAELMEVSQALSNAADDQRPSVRELADVVRGGMAVRLRDRPPLFERLRYRMFWRPVSRPHWGWMRDDLRSRSLGFRVSLWVLSGSIATFAVLSLVNGPLDRQGVIFFTLFFLGFAGLGSQSKARQFRARIHMRVGFDLTTWGELQPVDGVAPPLPAWPSLPPPPPPRVPAPNGRVPIRQFVWPLACWGLACGAAFIAGAARPNTETSVFGFRYGSDPNSPLTSPEVMRWSMWLAAASVALVGIVMATGRLRSRKVSRETLHPVNELTRQTQRAIWAILSVSAIPALAVGLAGNMPDLACAVIGSYSVLGAATLAGLGLVAWHAENRLNRPISLADLLVGELWQRRWDGLAPGDFIGLTNVTNQPDG